MSPIRTSLDEETKALIAALERRQKDLLDFQIPRLRSCKGPLTTQQQYAAELREDVDVFARQLDTLDVAVDDQTGERNRRELRQIVEDFRQTLARLRKDARTALLASKRAIDANALSNREELLRSSAVRKTQDLKEQVAEDALMTANNNVTETLQRTLQLMQGELEKSVLSVQLLDTSSASLRSASSTHDTLDNFLQTSKHLITALEKSDWLDRMLILAALLFFILVVAFIMQQRVVKKGLKVAFWWARFIPAGRSDKGPVRVDVTEKSSATTTATESALTSVVASTVSMLATAASTALSTSIPGTSSPPVEPEPPVALGSDIIDTILDTIASSQAASEPATVLRTTTMDSDLPASMSDAKGPEIVIDTIPAVSSVHDEL